MEQLIVEVMDAPGTLTVKEYVGTMTMKTLRQTWYAVFAKKVMGMKEVEMKEVGEGSGND